MSEDVTKKRIAEIREAGEDFDKLRKCLCPFFQKGDCPDCISCLCEDDDVLECKKYFLDHIKIHPMDIWSPEFDVVKVQSREKVSINETIGIGINCDTCYMYDKCPLYKMGYACGIDWGDGRPSTPEAYYEFLVNTQYERVKRASVFEKIDGGVPDANLSGEMDRLSGYILSRLDLNRERLSVNIEATGSASGSSGGGGILAKLFGGGVSAPATKEIPAETETRKDLITEAEVVTEPVKVPRRRRNVGDSE